MSGMYIQSCETVANLTNYCTEFADVTEGVLKVLGPLINDEKIRPYFRSLSVRLDSSTSTAYIHP